MTIEYENTLEEYREMTLAINKRNARLQQRKFTPTRIIAICVFLAMITAIDFLPTDPFDIIIPWVSLVLLVFAQGIQTWLISKRKFRLTLRSLIGWVVFIPAVVWFCFIVRLDMSNHPNHLHWQLLMPHMGWFALVVMTGYALIRYRITIVRKMWEGQPTLPRKHTAEITVDGIVISSPCERLEYRWNAFLRCDETDALFLVCTGLYTCHMLPKQAFHGAEELNAFRALTRLIPGNKPLGFSVTLAPAMDSPQNPAPS